MIGAADKLKSWTVTGTLTLLTTLPLVPVTVTVKVATALGHDTDNVAMFAAGRTRELVIVAVQPEGAPLATSDTLPEKLPTGVMVIVEFPSTVASVVMDVGLAVIVNPERTTGTPIVRDKLLGGVPAVPVIVTVNPLLGSGLHDTDSVLAVIVAEHPAG